MKQLDALADAFLSGDSLFRFVYMPKTNALFLEEELEEADNGQFLYVPYKDARDLYMEMSHFVDRQQGDIEQQLYAALCSPSPISKFEKTIPLLGLQQQWQVCKIEFAKKHIKQWLAEHQLVAE